MIPSPNELNSNKKTHVGFASQQKPTQAYLFALPEAISVSHQ